MSRDYLLENLTYTGLADAHWLFSPTMAAKYEMFYLLYLLCFVNLNSIYTLAVYTSANVYEWKF